MKKYLQKLICMICIISMVSLLFSSCSRRPILYQSMDTAMGTIISQTIYASADEKSAQGIMQEMMSCIDELEQKHLSWRLETSEIYKVNANAGEEQGTEISDLLRDALSQCLKVYAASDGAFDFTVGSVGRLWNIDTWANTSYTDEQITFVPPTDEELAAAMEYVGGDRCALDGESVALPEGMQLDLGAVGKGIALDELRKLLQQQEEISGGVISVGGSILTCGSKPDGSNWNVGIVNPFDTSTNLGTLSLSGDWCVSTSGDYERYVEVDGVRFHHILDPHTGKPANSNVKSVTIICSVENIPNHAGLFSDALSTACFVLGVEEGLKLAEEFGAEALFVDGQGKIFMTDGMEQYFYLSNEAK